MRIFTLVISFIAVFTTALPILRASFWWIRIFDYPRLQIAMLCLISLVLIAFYIKKRTHKTILTVLVSLSFLYQAFLIFPYTLLSPVQAENYDGKENNSSFTILEANIKMDNRKVKDFLAMVNENDPDILVITEPDKWWQESLKSLDKKYPYSLKKPLSNTYGMILLSKLPLKDQEINYLVDDDIPSFFTKVILPDKQEFDLYTLHPKPPKPGTSTYERDTEILIVGQQIRHSKRPTVVVGDLNDVGWSYTSQLFQKYSRMLDPRKGRGLYNTYNVNIPLFRYPLDHFFYSKHFGFVQIKKLDEIGSDHYPMLIEINLKTKKEFMKDLPEADQDDKEEVQETLRDSSKKNELLQ